MQNLTFEKKTQNCSYMFGYISFWSFGLIFCSDFNLRINVFLKGNFWIFSKTFFKGKSYLQVTKYESVVLYYNRFHMGCWKWENNCLDTHLLEKGMDLFGHFLTTFEFRLWRICTFYEFLALCESTMYTRNAFRNINMTSCCNNKVCKRMIFLYIKNDMIDLSKYYL